LPVDQGRSPRWKRSTRRSASTRCISST
jgi:hypothetical protein